MAKCRLCKTDIPEGEEYCKNCLDKKDEKAKESYLDSLLNSVKNADSPPAGNYVKKQADHATRKSEPELPTEDEDIFTIDVDDLDGFKQLDLSSDLEDDIIIRDEDLFGEDFTDDKHKKAAPELVLPAAQTTDITSDKITEEPASDSVTDEITEEPVSDNVTDEVPEESEENIDSEFLKKEDLAQTREEPEDEDITDPALGELLNGLDLSGKGDNAEKSIPEENEIEEELNPDEEDILNLLNQFDPNDPLSKDVKAIGRMLGGKPIEEDLDLPGDVGEVFSNALKVVSSLDDAKADEKLSESAEDGGEERKHKKIKKSKKNKKSKKDKKRKKVKQEKSKTDSEGKSVFGKLFGNVEDEKTKAAAAKIKKQKEEVAVTEDQTGKKGKKSKVKKGAVETEAQVTGRPSRPGRPGEEKPDKEEDKKAKNKEKKKEKKKKKKKAIIQVIDELDGEEGRINRLGASIVFLFFGIMVMVLLIGTNIFTYSLNIKNANNYFTRQKYSQAYNEVYGMEIKDEDVEIYDKIMTVMFVNKQLNSYNNYYAMEKYPEALDALLKGLRRYDKYIELATMLGIKSDLDYVRDQIYSELNNVFNLTEEEALSIINSGSQADYSIAVYDAILEQR